ncbi:MAG TPA: Rrf2 family transcriptional regulator [Chitinophaga sp.]|nr:Rrf2 family transcriptional regulator [Chitinophaga sp.]
MVKSKFAISVHILSLLSLSDTEWLSSDMIAGSLNTNPALVRKELAALKEAGFVEGKEGKNGGSKLARPADSILLSDIFGLVKETHIFGFSPNLPNPNCTIGANINGALDHLFNEIDRSVYEQLKNITLAEFSARLVS